MYIAPIHSEPNMYCQWYIEIYWIVFNVCQATWQACVRTWTAYCTFVYVYIQKHIEHVDMKYTNCWIWATGDTVFILHIYIHIQVKYIDSFELTSQVRRYACWRLLDDMYMQHWYNYKFNYDFTNAVNVMCNLFTRNGFLQLQMENCFRTNWSNCFAITVTATAETTKKNYGIVHVEKII